MLDAMRTLINDPEGNEFLFVLTSGEEFVGVVTDRIVTSSGTPLIFEVEDAYDRRLIPWSSVSYVKI